MNRGFTLIELIVVLLLVGILVMSAAISLLPMSEALALARTNASVAQKSRLAFARLSREFTTITNVVSGAARSFSYEFLDPDGNPHLHTLVWSGTPGDPLQLDGAPLSDDIADFELSYYDAPGGTAQAAWTADSRLIEMVMESRATGDRYTNRIAPRNIGGGGGGP